VRAKTFVGEAGPKGRGVFASRLIRRSSVIGTLRGKPKWIWDIPQEIWPYTIQVDYDRYVVPRKNGPVWYINHSCEPNCLISGQNITAGRDIRKGEELTFDYSTDVDWPGFNMDCRCGSSKCRKVIRAYRFLPEGLKREYGGHVAPFILKAYLRGSKAPRSASAEPAGRRAGPRGP
jgi:uncharacterized protein